MPVALMRALAWTTGPLTRHDPPPKDPEPLLPELLPLPEDPEPLLPELLPLPEDPESLLPELPPLPEEGAVIGGTCGSASAAATTVAQSLGGVAPMKTA